MYCGNLDTLLWMKIPTNTFVIELPGNSFDLFQFGLSAKKPSCRMFLWISQGYSTICLRHIFKRLLAFFHLSMKPNQSYLSRMFVTAFQTPLCAPTSWQGLDLAPKMGQPSKQGSLSNLFTSFLFPKVKIKTIEPNY